jgi:hypothetical protein
MNALAVTSLAMGIVPWMVLVSLAGRLPYLIVAVDILAVTLALWAHASPLVEMAAVVLLGTLTLGAPSAATALGLVALWQIRRSGYRQTGRALAIIGALAGASFAVVALCLAFVVACVV